MNLTGISTPQECEKVCGIDFAHIWRIVLFPCTELNSQTAKGSLYIAVFQPNSGGRGGRPKIDPFNEKGLQIVNQGCRFFKNVFGAESTLSKLKILRLRRTSM